MSIYPVTIPLPVSFPLTSFPPVKETDWRLIAKTITELFLQVITPLALVLLLSLLAPSSMSAIVLPSVALCAVALGPFIFMERPEPPLPPGAPRGIERAGNNCWVNTMFQMLSADEQIMQWIRSDECPRRLQSFKEFAAAYDGAMQEGRSIVNADSQMLRVCLANFSGIDPSSDIQEDMTEGLISIFGCLPARFFVQMQEKRRYGSSDDGVAILPVEAEREQTIDNCGHLSFALVGNAPSLNDLWEYHFRPPMGHSRAFLSLPGVDGRRHNYQMLEEERRYNSAPLSLWIDFKRFQGDEKICTPVDIPDMYEVRSCLQAPVQYRLDAIAVHEGGKKNGGHYISLRLNKEDGNWYKIDDHKVRAVEYEEMREYLKQSYQIHFSRV